MLRVLGLGDIVVNLVVGIVNLVPVVVDISFPTGNSMREKGLVGLLEFPRVSCIYPSSV